jgi:hypothetical protein
MDTRFSSKDRSALTMIALRYNLKTGECFPAHGRIAVEAGLGEGATGSKAVQRAVSKAVAFGWLRRTSRYGGPREKSQTNQYELTLPQSIRDVLANAGPELAITGEPGAWQVAQVTDGRAICGPFKDRANAERWIEEHGPRGQIARARGQIEGGEGTLEPPITWKSKKLEVIEHSVSSIQHRSPNGETMPSQNPLSKVHFSAEQQARKEGGLPRGSPF